VLAVAQSQLNTAEIAVRIQTFVASSLGEVS
jgi:hypothetical protein